MCQTDSKWHLIGLNKHWLKEKTTNSLKVYKYSSIYRMKQNEKLTQVPRQAPSMWKDNRTTYPWQGRCYPVLPTKILTSK